MAAKQQLPAYVREALTGITRAQRRFVLDGCIHGDTTALTIRGLQQKALFYFHPTSPNGRCGDLRLTPLGETVRSILRERAAMTAPAKGPHP